MKTPRLLPVVIAAIAALILFKGIGLLTNGGYVLTGSTPAVASGAAPAAEGGATDGPTMQLPQDVTMTDASPTMTDSAVTLPLKADDPNAAHGAADAPAADAGAADGKASEGAAATGDGGHGAAATADQQATGSTDCPTTPDAATPDAAAAATHAQAPADAKTQKEDFAKGFDFVRPRGDCTPDPGVNAAGDALPLVTTGDGKKVPLADLDPGSNSQDQLLERLAERRAELDKRSADLDMRETLVQAAEKRLDERTAELKALEDKVNQLVKEKDTAEQQQFVSIVAMYEAMKPKDAAAIFDQLEMPVLLKVTRAMSPRKMAPILAAMSTTKAKDLTANLAADQGQQTVQVGQDNTADLPQIVGQ